MRRRDDTAPGSLPRFLPDVVFVVVILTPTLANYFGLLRAGGLERDVMLVAVPLWFLSLRTAWRTKLFERFLSVDDLE